ncbi:Uncharacterised protein [Trueperella bialowiezensis]|uniref:Uncharacterized protein n=2 Tax=Trueperella bialowiezensis TaxID=312285 RepID=A0A448PGQ8_9ACTO|nr:Uncharacterised protein [Trueperella bialowiezensis]
MVCVWPEDEYKLPHLVMYAENFREMMDTIGADMEPTLYAEPNIKRISDEASVVDGAVREYPEYTQIRVIYPFGAAEGSWAAARGYVDPSLWQCDSSVSPLSDDEVRMNHFLLLDLMTNWTYGDIGYSDFSSGNQEYTESSHSLGAQLAPLSREDQIAKLADYLTHFRDTCEISEG